LEVRRTLYHTAVETLRLPERDEHRDAVLRAHASRDVSFAGHVFGEQDVARSERNFLPAYELNP
jgi:hypothetical protein